MAMMSSTNYKFKNEVGINKIPETRNDGITVRKFLTLAFITA